MIDYGSDGMEGDRRGDGAVVARDGNQYETLNWTAFAEEGKMIVAEYRGTYDGKSFRRIEFDNRGTENPTVDANFLFPRAELATLSDVRFMDAELVGHDFNFKTGLASSSLDPYALTESGLPKYVVPNKFVPYEYDYEVKVPAGQSTVTFTPVATTNRIAGMTVNGEEHASRCPVTVPVSSPAVVEVTAPDGKTVMTYTFTFIAE